MESTLTDVEDSSLTGHPNSPQLKPRPALVLCWSLEEPHRIGEMILLPAKGEPLILGRGEAQDSDQHVRARLVRQRPGAIEQMPPIGSRRISRQQLILSRDGDAIEVENIGRCELLWRDRVVKRCTLTPGDCISLKNQMLLCCVERSALMPALRISPDGPLHTFAEPDADGIVGESPDIWTLREQILFFAQREQHALVLGPSGSGKELVARAIHAHSARVAKPLIARNAATIPEGLFDAELFGNARNYPNPGMPERPGLVGEADGSSLFLDEIGELPTTLQSHLLRLLDSGGEYHRLGEARQRTTDIRLIAATNRAIDELKHDFRARFLLNLPLPDLNARREDIPLLARHLLKLSAERDPDLRRLYFTPEDAPHPDEPRLAPELVQALVRHTYTHHVRELEALLWSSITSSSGTWLRLTDVVRAALNTSSGDDDDSDDDDIVSYDAIREEDIRASLARHDGVQSLVWRELRLKNRYVLRRLLKKFGIDANEYVHADEP